jgi:hypothetical protein
MTELTGSPATRSVVSGTSDIAVAPSAGYFWDGADTALQQRSRATYSTARASKERV